MTKSIWTNPWTIAGLLALVVVAVVGYNRGWFGGQRIMGGCENFPCPDGQECSTGPTGKPQCTPDSRQQQVVQFVRPTIITPRPTPPPPPPPTPGVG